MESMLGMGPSLFFSNSNELKLSLTWTIRVFTFELEPNQTKPNFRAFLKKILLLFVFLSLDFFSEFIHIFWEKFLNGNYLKT